MKNTAIRILTALIFVLLGGTILREIDYLFHIENPLTFDQSCLLFIVLLLGLQMFKE